MICAFSGAASAAARYTVEVNVPHDVQVGQTFEIKATGISSTRSHLEVFVAIKRCGKSVAAEAERASSAPISKNVLERYTGSKTVHAKPGTHHVCAYLTPIGRSSITRARSTSTYYVLVGAY